MSHKTDKWFVSPWNFEPEVTKDLKFSKNIKFHDVSLRDGEQQAGLIFNKDEKIRIAKKLAEVGIHRIEAGMPAVSEQDEAAIKEIVKMKLGPEIFAFARCMKVDVEKAAACGVDGIVVEIPSSEHLIQKAYKWPLEKTIEKSIEATLAAKEAGLYTVFFPIDATRADIKWFLDLIEKIATEGHMDALAVVDTFGGIAPHAVPYLIKKIKERIKKPLEIHFHDDFGMGSANTVMALAAGAEVVHTTVTAIGERAGNAAYEDIALSLLTMYGVDTGLNYSKVYELAKLVQEIGDINVRPNRGLVGDMIYKVESGIISSWYKNCGKKDALEVFPLHWELLGHDEPEVVLGKNSGIDSVNIWLDKLGVSLDDEDTKLEIVQKIKDKAFEVHRLLTQDEFKAILEEVMG